MKRIESTQNKTIKDLCRLHKKKERDRSGLFLVEGEHLITEALEAHCLKEVFLAHDLPWTKDIPYTYCSDEVLNKLSVQNSQAKMIGLCQKKNWNFQNEKRILLLDDVQDPGNMGTLLRTACAFGIQHIYCSSGCADIYNPKTIQSSQGAIFHIPVTVTDLSQIIVQKQKEGLCIYGTSLHDRSIELSKADGTDAYAIILGNEGQGVHKELIELCDAVLKIEMASFESLNVAIAGGILMYQFYQKQGARS